jgi:predicted amidohydrolase
MSRPIIVGAAQLGAIQKTDTRESVIKRMIELVREAHSRGCRLVVFPEMALTTFFPRWFIEDQEEIDKYFEASMPNTATQPLFDLAKKLGIGFYLGYCELTQEGGKTRRYNASILVNQKGKIVGKYRKVHLPGHADYRPDYPWQHLEKRYFDVGDLGFPVWRTMGGVMGMCICNDRRWPEVYRVMGMQGVEMVMLGYNTPELDMLRGEPAHIRVFHNNLSMQAGAYQNGTWVVAAAKTGHEGGVDMMGGSLIVTPQGEIVALAHTPEDELITAKCDLDECSFNKQNIFNFAAHRQIQHYSLITERAGAIAPTADADA